MAERPVYRRVGHALACRRLSYPAIAILALATVLTVEAATAPTWLDLVAPIVTPAEKKAWLALTPAERPKYEEQFWTQHSITAKEYTERLAYVDAKFGSTKLG